MLSDSQILPARPALNSTSKWLKYVEQHTSTCTFVKNINYLHKEANIDVKHSRCIRTEYDINDHLE